MSSSSVVWPESSKDLLRRACQGSGILIDRENLSRDISHNQLISLIISHIPL